MHYKDIVPNSDERLGLRVTKGGTPQDDSNYDNGNLRYHMIYCIDCA